MTLTVAIVDGYSTAAQFCEIFSAYGIRCVHIQANKIVPPHFKATFNISQYKENFIFDDKLGVDYLLNQLKPYKLKYIIPGCETGVDLTNKLNISLGSESDLNLTIARRNKYFMIETIKNAGLRYPLAYKANNLDDLVTWISKNINSWPIIAKPVASCSNDGVTRCNNLEDVKQAFQNVIGNLNVAGHTNSDLLVEEFLYGEEHVVNTVGLNGQHFITDIWKYKWIWDDNRNTAIRDTIKLVKFDPKIHSELAQYTLDVVKALGIMIGATHNEIMMTQQGPVLIESGARLMGGNFSAKCLREVLGYSQVDLTVMAYINPNALQKYLNTTYQIKKHALVICLISQQKGVIKNLNHLKKLKELASFCDAGIKGIGQSITYTIDQLTSPGMVYLVHEDETIIQQDYEIIRNMEKSNFFDLN